MAAAASSIVAQVPSNAAAEPMGGWAVSAIADAKLRLINVCSATMLFEPRYYSTTDETRQRIVDGVHAVVGAGDAAFPLKLAYFLREKMNIRSTSNFLIAVAAQLDACRPAVAAFVPLATRLPTDLLEIADLYAALTAGAGEGADGGDGGDGEDGAAAAAAGKAQRVRLPACLRTAFAKRFARFDEYQLAKHNHDSAAKGRKLKAKKKAAAAAAAAPVAVVPAAPAARRGRRGGAGRGKPAPAPAPAAATAAPQQRKMTLKQLVRAIHATEPRRAVLAILGKKWARTESEHAERKLPGAFVPELAGQRVKMPVPETWETQVSARGNKAEVWEDLIAHRKLPIMAMLRNLRNLIVTGVAPECHGLVQRTLRNETVIARSRQLPFRFFAAYDVLAALQRAEGAAATGAAGANGTLALAERISEVAGVPLDAAAALLRRYHNNAAAAIDAALSGVLVPVTDADREAVGVAEGAAASERDKLPIPLSVLHGSRPDGSAAAGGKRRAPSGNAAAAAAAAASQAKRREITPKHHPTYEVVRRYREALDDAVRLATIANVPVIRGRTVVFTDVSGSMQYVRSSTARGLGSSLVHPYEIAMVLGLMINSTAESSEFRVLGARLGRSPTDKCHALVQIPEARRYKILENVELVKRAASEVSGGNEFPFEYFEDMIDQRIWVDRVVILCDCMISGLGDSVQPGLARHPERAWTIESIMAEYRKVVNPRFEFIVIDLFGSGKSLTSVGEGADPLNILLTGFSDKLLQFIADRSAGSQLEAIDKISAAELAAPRQKKDDDAAADAAAAASSADAAQ